MIIKTTKKIGIDLHSDKKAIVEFEYSYERTINGLRVRVKPFAPQTILGMDSKSIVARQPIAGAETVRQFTEDEVTQLLGKIADMTAPSDNPLIYMDHLVANGIKVIIVSEGLWKGALTIKDFE